MSDRRCCLLSVLSGLLLALAPQPAAACLGAFAERYVFQPVKPAHIPPGLTSIEVTAPTAPSEGGEIIAPLAAASIGLPAGTMVRIEPGLWTSCSNWGSIGQRVFVIGLFVPTKEGPVFAAVQLRKVKNFRLDPAMDAKLVIGMKDYGYSDLVARAAIMIAEANLDDYDDFNDFLDDVQRQADLLDPKVKVGKVK